MPRGRPKISPKLKFSKAISIRLEPPYYRLLYRYCRHEQMTPYQAIRAIVKAFFDRDEPYRGIHHDVSVVVNDAYGFDLGDLIENQNTHEVFIATGIHTLPDGRVRIDGVRPKRNKEQP